VTLLGVGTRTGKDSGAYSDIDLTFDAVLGYRHKDGTPY
jgi:uncharacterized cupin superfamily protein